MGLNATLRAAALGVDTKFDNSRVGAAGFLPQRIAVVGAGNIANTFSTTVLKNIDSESQVGTVYGQGSPVHLAVRELLPPTGGGVGSIPIDVYGLQEGGSATAATNTITPSGTQTTTGQYVVTVNGISSLPFVVTAGDSVATIIGNMVTAINGVLHMPVIATDTTTEVTLTTKFAGVIANECSAVVTGPSGGVVFAVTSFSGGTVNPVISGALSQLGNTWTTWIVNCSNVEDTTTLDALQTTGEVRWSPEVYRPYVAVTGDTPATTAAATTVPSARSTDRINSIAQNPGGVELPWVVAGAHVAAMAVIAQNSPAVDYNGQKLTTLAVGTFDPTLAQRDTMVKGGASTAEIRDGVVEISDMVTCYHPTNDPSLAFTKVVTLVKLMQAIHQVDARFSRQDWRAAPIVAETAVVNEPAAKKPSSAVADIAIILDALESSAIIASAAEAKARTVVALDQTNPNRLNATIGFDVSGNSNIRDVTLQFAFFRG